MAAHGERFDLLLGRRTYDIWSGFWPKAPGSPIGDRLNAATKYIATHRPESLAWGPWRPWETTRRRVKVGSEARAANLPADNRHGSHRRRSLRANVELGRFPAASR
jgi:dihydrofolate reductase